MTTINYRLTLRERLKDREEWLNSHLIYIKHKDITHRASKETQGTVPIAPILLKIYFLPTIILKFFSDFRDWYYYNQCSREIKIIKEELNKNDIR